MRRSLVLHVLTVVVQSIDALAFQVDLRLYCGKTIFVDEIRLSSSLVYLHCKVLFQCVSIFLSSYSGMSRL